MNTRERFVAVMNFETPDRNLLWEMGYWPGTLERWYRESLERGVNRQGTPGLAFARKLPPTTRFREGDAYNVLGFDPGLMNIPMNSGPQPLFSQDVFEETA